MVSRPSGKQRHLHVSNEDRKWAGNYAIQATTDANIVSIEISYCKSERFAHVMGIPQDIPQNLKRHKILGHIGQIHLVSTELNAPFLLNTWGGYSKYWGEI